MANRAAYETDSRNVSLADKRAIRAMLRTVRGMRVYVVGTGAWKFIGTEFIDPVTRTISHGPSYPYTVAGATELLSAVRP